MTPIRARPLCEPGNSIPFSPDPGRLVPRSGARSHGQTAD
jgi:hypothetical protein